MDLLQFVADVDKAALRSLYQSEWVCQVIFRSLSELGQQYVLRLLYVDKPVPDKSFDSVTPESSAGWQHVAMDQLAKLGILNTHKGMMKLYDDFRQNLVASLYRVPPPPLGSIVHDVSPDDIVTDQDLDAFSNSRWTHVLEFIVDSSESGMSGSLRPATIDLLERSGLIVPRGTHWAITNNGFQFLLGEMRAQLWGLLKAYLFHSDRDARVSNALTRFLLELSFLESGKPYPISALNEEQLSMLADLEDLGIVYRPSPNSPVYYPTKLASSQVSSAALRQQSLSGTGYLIVETNFRLYAYTSSPLQIALLGLFTFVKYRLPNLVVCAISRESIRLALAGGIKAEQIVRFLEENAHPSMYDAHRFTNKAIPETVTDQIHLWEMECNRIETNPATAFTDIEEQVYLSLCTFANDIGAILWLSPSPSLRTLVVKKEAADDVRKHYNLLMRQVRNDSTDEA